MEPGNNIDQAIQVNATSLRNRAAKNSNDGKELGKQDFLNLLMTQMANQDPLDPMEPMGPEGHMQPAAGGGGPHPPWIHWIPWIPPLSPLLSPCPCSFRSIARDFATG